LSACAECKVFVCRSGHLEAAPDDCPMRDEALVDTRASLEDPVLRRMARESALIEAEGYCHWTRVEETVEFARRIGVTKLGVAFCVGLRDEARLLSRVLTANGFDVASVACKTGSIPKEELGIADHEKVRPGTFEAMCNPIAQARVLNAAGTGLNVVFGLCVGHDSLFIKHSEAPVTCLVAKDRVLAHNPIGALNCSSGYYHRALYDSHRG
jgi:uncharacterized metal-binding protein